MANRFKSDQTKKESWLRKNGSKVAEKGMELAQHAVVYAGLATDPQTAFIALQEMNQPSFEQLAKANEIDKKQNKAPKVSNRFKKVIGPSNYKTSNRKRIKKAPVKKVGKKSIKRENRSLRQKNEQYKVKRQKAR